MRPFKRPLISILFSLALLAPLLLWTPAQGVEEDELPLSIHADNLVWDREKGLVTAQGFAHVRFSGAFLSADWMEYRIASGDLKASGSVVFEYEDSRIFARRMDYNINTTLAVMYDAEGFINGSYRITGKKVERISQTEYRLEEGTFTTCLCGEPAWLFTLNKGILRTEKYAVLRGVGLSVKGVPVAALPLAVVPAITERSTGFLFPLVGVSSLKGVTVKNRFFWAINDWSDATLGLDYLSKRGLRPNLELRYIISRDSRGQFFGSLLKDRARDTTFYEIRGGHYQSFKNGVVSEARVDLESAVSPSRTFELDVEKRAKVRTDSFLYARKNWKHRALQMENRYFRSTTGPGDVSFAKVPELTFTNVRERLFQTPLYYDLTLSFSNFIDEPQGGANRHYARFDFFPRLTFPVGSLSWWDFTQTVGIRETAYTEERGVDEPLNRELFFSQSRLEAPRLYRAFNFKLGGIQRILHIIEPVLTYSYISDNDAETERRITIIDGIDDFSSTNTVSYSFTNRFIARESGDGEKKRIREVARVTLGQSYDIKKERRRGGADPFSDIIIDVETWFMPSLRVNFDGVYSLEEDDLEIMNFEVDYKPIQSLTFVFDSRLKRGRRPGGPPRTDYIRAGVGLNLGRQWYLEYAARFNLLLKKETVDNSFIVSYSSQCWGITARLVNRADETTVDFQIELKGVIGLGERIGRLVHAEVLPRL